jgi:drug efflux transport system permease protein
VSPGRLRELVRKETRQMLRDPRMTRIIFIAPVVQLMVFGYAVNTDVRNAPTIVVDQDATQTSRALADALASSGNFRIVARSNVTADAERALDRGTVLAAVVIPPQFEREVGAGKPTAVQVLVDGTRSNSANLVRGYAARSIQHFALPQSPPSAVDFRPEVWYNPDLESRVYNVPAVAGVIVQVMCLLLTALSVVRERELGTLEQLMVSPIEPSELILGKTVPVAVVGLIDLIIVTVVALVWFKIPFRGSFTLLIGASVLYILAGLGAGLLISAVSRTQQEAFMTMFLFFLPAMLLSGFMFPLTSMPRPIQWLTLANPIRHYLEIVRGIFLKGAGVRELWTGLSALAVMAAGLLLLATRSFRKQL